MEVNGKINVLGAGYTEPLDLNDGSSITWDWSIAQCANVSIGGTRTLANPTNALNGQYATLRVTRTGLFVLNFGNLFKGVGGILQTLGSGAVDHFVFRYNGSTFELVNFRANVGA